MIKEGGRDGRGSSALAVSSAYPHTILTPSSPPSRHQSSTEPEVVSVSLYITLLFFSFPRHQRSITQKHRTRREVKRFAAGTSGDRQTRRETPRLWTIAVLYMLVYIYIYSRCTGTLQCALLLVTLHCAHVVFITYSKLDLVPICIKSLLFLTLSMLPSSSPRLYSTNSMFATVSLKDVIPSAWLVWVILLTSDIIVCGIHQSPRSFRRPNFPVSSSRPCVVLFSHVPSPCILFPLTLPLSFILSLHIYIFVHPLHVYNMFCNYH